MPTEAAAGSPPPSWPEEFVQREGLLFRLGDYAEVYPDFRFDAADLRAAVADFRPVPVELEHTLSGGTLHILDGHLGFVESVWVGPDGASLHGRVRLPRWLDRRHQEEGGKVSATFDPASKRLLALGVVFHPRVDDAALTIFGDFAAAHPEAAVTFAAAEPALARYAARGRTPTPAGSPESPPRRDRDGAGGRGPIPEPGGTTAMAATQTQSDERDDGTTAADRGDRDGAPGGDAGRGRDHDDPGDDPAALKAVLDRTRKALADANRKAETERKQYKAARERLDDLDRAAEERRKEELPEVERLRNDLRARDAEIRAREGRVAELERESTALRIAHQVEREAQKAGFLYPEDVPKLVDASRIEVEPETGRILGVKEAVERLAKDRPGLLAAPRGGGSPAAVPQRRPVAGGANEAPPVDMRAELRRHVRYPA
jgi:hypothetical protein